MVISITFTKYLYSILPTCRSFRVITLVEIDLLLLLLHKKRFIRYGLMFSLIETNRISYKKARK